MSYSITAHCLLVHLYSSLFAAVATAQKNVGKIIKQRTFHTVTVCTLFDTECDTTQIVPIINEKCRVAYSVADCF